MPHALTLIAAVARNRVIGHGNALVWRHPADMAYFKRATQGHTVIMGRRTWESLPERFRPLPGRRNIVVTRQQAYAAPGAELASSFPAALELAIGSEAFVMGGGELYAAALPLADRLLLTEVDCAPDGDTFFPPFSAKDWRPVTREAQTDAAGPSFAFVTYLRASR